MDNKIQQLIDGALECINEDNIEEGEKKLLEAANLGSTEAKFYLGMFYTIEKEDREASLYWTKQAVDEGNADAALLLVSSYINEDGEYSNKEEALYWLQKACDLGNAEAQFYLGQIYGEGEIVKADHDKALQLIMLSAKNGYDEAQYELGEEYLSGDILEKNKEQAIYWLTKAAEQNYQAAKLALANIYCEDGNPDGVNMIIALAEEEYWFAQNQLAEMYEKGIYVEKDLEKAKYWKELAGDNTLE